MLMGLLDLLLPPLCIGCRKQLVCGEELICTICLHGLPETNCHLQTDNPITHRLASSSAIAYAFAHYWLYKKSPLEQLLFAMKYRSRPEIGKLLGQLYGQLLRLHQQAVMQTIDGIIAIPLHPRKLKERGYNQSDFIAEGFSAALEIPFYTDYVVRTRHTASQTNKNKTERMVNLQDAFHVSQPAYIVGKHLLVVDDVLTTGATLASCATILLTHGARAVGIATLAVVEEG